MLENLSTLHRESLKCVEEELHILDEEPDDLIKNLETLISVRTAMEAEAPQSRERERTAPQAPQAPSKGIAGRNVKRKLDAVISDASTEPATPTPQPEPVVSINLPHKPPVANAPSMKKGSRSGSINVGKSDSLSETDSIKSEVLYSSA